MATNPGARRRLTIVTSERSNPDEVGAETKRRIDPSVRSVSRALQLLQALNLRPVWTLHELHLQTGLPKSTLFRLLFTLKTLGFVREDASASQFRVTRKVRELSSGFLETSGFVEVASGIAISLTKTVTWPVAAGILEGGFIVVCASGMPYSPLAPRTTTLGFKLGLCNTAMGQAYLANCSAIEREMLLDMLRAGGTEVPSRSVLDAALELVRRDGYARRRPSEDRQTASIAVPVRSGSTVLGVLSMSTFGTSMTNALVQKSVPLLIDAAQRVATACAAAKAGEFTHQEE